MNDRALSIALAQTVLQALMEDPLLWPVLLCALLFFGAALIGLSILLTKIHASTSTRHSPPRDVSLLSPTLATELLAPNAAQAWLLSVALDLAIAQRPSLPRETSRTLTALARSTRLLLIQTLRDHPTPDDARILPLTRAILDLTHALTHRSEALDKPTKTLTLELQSLRPTAHPE